MDKFEQKLPKDNKNGFNLISQEEHKYLNNTEGFLNLMKKKHKS